MATVNTSKFDKAAAEVRAILDKDYPEMEKLFNLLKANRTMVKVTLGAGQFSDALNIASAWDGMEKATKDLTDEITAQRAILDNSVQKTSTLPAEKQPALMKSLQNREVMYEPVDYDALEARAQAINKRLGDAGVTAKKGKK
jgi:hypothetical protein